MLCRDTLDTSIGEACETAKNSDVVVVVLGGSSARDFETDFLETGAAVANERKEGDMESGEGFDRIGLSLMGKQVELLKTLYATGKPVVLVMIQGRPLELNWAAEHIPAILTAWYPGGEGGRAIADVLFGVITLPDGSPCLILVTWGNYPCIIIINLPDDMIMWRELLPHYILSGTG